MKRKLIIFLVFLVITAIFWTFLYFTNTIYDVL